MAEFRDQFLTANGLRVHYLEWGDPAADPIVLLHGTTSNAHSWDRVCESLSERYRCLAFDCRDHGESERSPDAFNRDTLVEDVEASVDALNLTSFGLIGLSMGGRTAMLYAGHHPDRVNRLVIEDIGPETPAAATQRVMQIIGGTPKSFASVAEFVEQSRKSKPYAPEEWLFHMAKYALRQLPDGRYENKYAGSRVQAPMTTEIDLWQHIGKITCPTLIIRGGESDILDEAIMARMVESIPNGESVTIPQAWHAVHEDNPVESISVYRRFFGLS